MFRWLKRRAEIAVLRQMEEDIDRFLAGLRGADSSELGMVVAVATHWRRIFEEDNVDFLDPIHAKLANPLIAVKINRLIAKVQKENPELASGLMVWLHTLRAANNPEIRIKGRAMWGELRRGFGEAYQGSLDISEILGIKLHIESEADFWQIPEFLEPDFG